MSNIFSRTGLRALALSATIAAVGAVSVPALAADTTVHYFNGGAVHQLQDLRLNPNAKVNCGVQWSSSIPANSSQLWFTFNWNAASYIDWTVMSDSIYSGGTEVTLSNVATQRTDSTHVTYWLTVVNNSSSTQNFEGRYCIL